MMLPGVGKSQMASRYFLHGRSVIGDFKASELISVQTEDELVRVMGDAMVSTNIQPINCLPEARTEVVCTE